MSNYSAKSDLKEATSNNSLKFAKDVDLTNLKSDADKVHIDKLETVPVDLSKLSNVVKNNVVKKVFVKNE